MNFQNRIASALFWIGDTSVFIALCALWAVVGTYATFELPVNWSLGLFIGFSTLFTYNIQRRLGPVYKTGLFRSSKNVLIAIGLVGMVFFGVKLDIMQIGLLAVLGGVSMLYAQPFIPVNTGVIPLRNVPFIKLWIIVLVWVGVTVAVPVLPIKDSDNLWLYIAQQIFLIAALTIPFDIRDLDRDHPNQKTLPMVLGVKSAMRLAQVFCLVSLLLVWVNYGAGSFNLKLTLIHSISILLAMGVITKGANTSKLYHLIYLDGIILFQGLTLYLASI